MAKKAPKTAELIKKPADKQPKIKFRDAQGNYKEPPKGN